MSRPNKDFRTCPSSSDIFGGPTLPKRSLRCVLERANNRRPYRQNRPPLAPCSGNRSRRILRDFISFAVHFVVFQMLGPDGLKSSQTDLKRYLGDFDPFPA